MDGCFLSFNSIKIFMLSKNNIKGVVRGGGELSCELKNIATCQFFRNQAGKYQIIAHQMNSHSMENSEKYIESHFSSSRMCFESF